MSSATENGYKPWYLEECASTLAATYSSGAFYERKIVSGMGRVSSSSDRTQVQVQKGGSAAVGDSCGRHGSPMCPVMGPQVWPAASGLPPAVSVLE